MKILHYSLGFPPYRTGGMTKYCMDLIFEQLSLEHDVSLLWPGRIKEYNNDIDVRKRKNYKFNDKLNCGSFELINPLPVPLLNGIMDIDEFMKNKDYNKLYIFLKKERFDVIHVHTLMGLPIELIDAAKELNIRTIFTSHDYFGLCPKCSLMKGNKLCDSDNDCNDCITCNKTALNLKKIKFLQSPIYSKIKNTRFIKSLRKNKIKKINSDYESNIFMNNNLKVNNEKKEKYQNLRNFYVSFYKKFDLVLFNSTNTQIIYSRYYDAYDNSKVVSISNSMIKNNKKIKEIHKKINIGYLGPISSRKGYFFLLSVLEEIYNSGLKNFELHIFQHVQNNIPFVICHDPYNENTIKDVMNNLDIVIVPSIWYETFGFITLEALSFGVPVMVSENVGAKDLINKNNGLIFKNDSNDLKKKLELILNNPNILKDLNENIYNNQYIKSMTEHTKEICNFYIK